MATAPSSHSSPEFVLTVRLAADDLPGMFDLIEALAGQMDFPDRIAAICVDQDACRAEMDLAARPVDPRVLH